MVRVEHVLDSWRAVREDTIAAIEDFPAAEFDFRPAPEVATFGEIGRHILDAGHALAGMLVAGEEYFSAPGIRQRLKEQSAGLAADAGAPALAAALRESIERRTAALAACTPEFFSRMITRLDGQKVTKLEMVQFLKEHELTHRAQLFLCLRLKGITPATTRRRLAAQKAR